jgi:hypothetical protein
VLKRKTFSRKKALTPAQTGKAETEALNSREIVKDYFAYMGTPY